MCYNAFQGRHPGSPKLYDNITNLYFVKDRGKLKEYCNTMCSNCFMCTATKKDVNIHNVEIHMGWNLNKPNQCLSLDILELNTIVEEVGSTSIKLQIC